jgi:sterol desaturase/sphingolipid hydroxylase (fatty acid hydroxylase superfamily)
MVTIETIYFEHSKTGLGFNRMDGMFTEIARVRPAASFGLLVCFLAWESAAPAWQAFKAGDRFSHGARNLALGVINSVVIATVFAGLWAAAIEASFNTNSGLLRQFELSPIAAALIAIIALDLWTYAWHRLNHIVPFFWRFHRVHHSDARMDVTTATRFHLGEIVLSSLLRVPVLFGLGADLWHLALYELMMFSVVQFHHSNIRLPDTIDWLLRLFVVTPAMHRVHHSRDPHHQRSNFTSLLSIWDRIFGTFVTVEAAETLPLGVEGFDDVRLVGILSSPIAAAGSEPSEQVV